MLIDTQCHYNLSPLYENWQTHWQTANDHGVKKSIVIGTSIETSRRAIEIARSDKNLKASVGIHPHEYGQIDIDDLPTILHQQISALTMIATDQEVVAIGETGLDYFRLEDDDQDTRRHQQAGFGMQINLANQTDKILIVHVRDKGEAAYLKTLELIEKDYQFKSPLILHCFSGSPKYIQAAVKLGAYFGVAGNITYKNAKALRELLRLIPPDRLLLETDAPYLAPQNHRGQICQPWMVKETADYLQTELGIDISSSTQAFWDEFVDRS